MLKLTFAYLDAGTGALLLAALTGGVAGLKMYLSSLRAKYVGRRRLRGRGDDEESGEERRSDA